MFLGLNQVFYCWLIYKYTNITIKLKLNLMTLAVKLGFRSQAVVVFAVVVVAVVAVVAVVFVVLYRLAIDFFCAFQHFSWTLKFGNFF